MSSQFRPLLPAALLSAIALFGADFTMKVTDSDGTFVDQKNTAMELLLHGQRVATNGDVRLVPTPEQWDAVAALKGRDADKANSRLTARLSFPSYEMDYRLEVAAEPGGVRVATNGSEPYRKRVAELFPSAAQPFAFGGWSAVRALPCIWAEFKQQLAATVKT